MRKIISFRRLDGHYWSTELKIRYTSNVIHDLLSYKLLISQEKICQFQSLEYFPVSLYVYKAFLLKEIKKALKRTYPSSPLKEKYNQVLNFTFDLYQYLINLR